jgi:hypothetical protein
MTARRLFRAFWRAGRAFDDDVIRWLLQQVRTILIEGGETTDERE